MAQLIVRDLDERVVRALKERAAKNQRSAEAEHREILREVLLEEERNRARFIERAAESRSRLKSSIDSTDIIRADRDRDGT
jgi:plasmid stability protein